MIFITRFIYFLLKPLIWLIIALLFWSISKNERIKRIAKISALVIIFFFSNTVILTEAYRAWEIHTVKLEDVPTYDVGIVLGGMMQFDADTERLSMRRGGDRIWQALDLYYSGKIKKIALIGKNGGPGITWMDESLLMKQSLLKFGIPEEDIILEEESKNTYENAKMTATLLAEEYPELSSFVLITSAFHMKRAKACFNKQGLDVGVYPTDQRATIKRRYLWHDFIVPSPSAFMNWYDLLKEIVGYTIYAVLGYL